MAKKAAASGTSASSTPATKARTTSSAPAARAPSSTPATRTPSAAPGPVTGTRAKPAASDLSVEAVAKAPEAITGSAEAASATHEPSHEQIAQRAFELYQARGGYGDEEMSDWLRAERELRGQGR